MNRIDDRPRHFELHPRSLAISAAAPARVHQPDVRAVLLEPGRQQLGVFGRTPHEERPAKAGRKSRLRLRHANFGSRHLGRVAADVVVHRLGRIQSADRRQHAESVAGQEDDIGRMPTGARNLGVADELDRIGPASVLRDPRVMEIDAMGDLVIDDVLQNRAKAQRLVDFRLCFWRQVDRFGVTSSLDVENAVIGPAMLVVTDEQPIRIGGKRCLAGARQPEHQ